MSDYTVMAMAEQQSATVCNDDDSDGHSWEDPMDTVMRTPMDTVCNDDASDRHSDRKNWDSDSDDENSKPIQIEF